MKVKKEYYNKLAFYGPLAIEEYCDLNNIDMNGNEKIKQFYKLVNEYHELDKRRTEARDKMVEELLNLVEDIGVEKFSSIEDGNIGYNS